MSSLDSELASDPFDLFEELVVVLGAGVGDPGLDESVIAGH